MRTHIYIDGFNLYYGALKNTSFKWLDLSGLFRTLLKPNHDILKIKYFTAHVSGRSKDQLQPQRQNAYLRALEHHCPEVEIYFGRFRTHAVLMPLADSSNTAKFAKVMKTEEKGSDVNLAVHLLNDAWMNAYDCAIVVTNDSDVAEAMRLVKALKTKQIGLVTPRPRYPSRHLMIHADFSHRIGSVALRNNQLPSPIPGTKITKPSTW